MLEAFPLLSFNVSPIGDNVFMTKNTETSKPKIGGLFSGVGGIELGFEKSGFEVAWANEGDSFACTT